MSNREQRISKESVHILIALARPSQGEKRDCIRSVDRGIGNEVEILESKLKIIGGYWRIYRTVNERDYAKSLKILMKTLIDHPEKASSIDSEWRTALMQNDCIFGQKKFMLDIDTEDKDTLEVIDSLCGNNILDTIKTPKGWHYITLPFDTREVCKLDKVTLLRDGYYFIKEVGKRKENV